MPPPEALGGLKPGTGRALNALIKTYSVTGVERTGTVPDPLFKPGQVLDEMRTADGAAAQISFSFPEAWTLAGGPNLDVRDVRTSDSAFLLAAPLPSGASFESLTNDYFLDVLFAPEGKYGSYGVVEDRKVLASDVEVLTTPSGAKTLYRRISLRFAPLTYNGNTVERRALLSATHVGGTVFLLATGCLATRYKSLQTELVATQASFRAFGRSAKSS